MTSFEADDKSELWRVVLSQVEANLDKGEANVGDGDIPRGMSVERPTVSFGKFHMECPYICLVASFQVEYPREMMQEDGFDNAGLDAYLAMAAVWWSRVPPTLVHEPPAIVARIIDLGLREEGVSQSELQQKLGINQSRMSKLTKKLVGENLLRLDQSKTSSNGRRSLIATADARNLIRSLREHMAALLAGSGASACFPIRPKPSRSKSRRDIKPVPGQVPFELE